jgi:hypothetical protein
MKIASTVRTLLLAASLVFPTYGIAETAADYNNRGIAKAGKAISTARLPTTAARWNSTRNSPPLTAAAELPNKPRAISTARLPTTTARWNSTEIRHCLRRPRDFPLFESPLERGVEGFQPFFRLIKR